MPVSPHKAKEPRGSTLPLGGVHPVMVLTCLFLALISTPRESYLV